MSLEPQVPGLDEKSMDWTSARAFLLARIRHRLDREPKELHEDLAQIALVKLLRACRREAIESPNAFMTVLADGVVTDYLRWRRRWRLLMTGSDEGALEVAAEFADFAALEGDPLERLRFVVLEYFVTEDAKCADLAREFFADVPWKEVAERRGEKHNTVIQQWSRCVKRLRQAVRGDRNPLLEWTDE